MEIEVALMVNLYYYEDMYFKREFSLRSVFEYVKEVGVKAVFNKIKSRLSEKERNEKFYSIGIGQIAGTFNNKLQDQEVVFVAPVFPKACERLVVPEALILPISAEEFKKVKKEKRVLLFDFINEGNYPENNKHLCKELLGWHQESGIVLDNALIKAYLEKMKNLLLSLPLKLAKNLKLGTLSFGGNLKGWGRSYYKNKKQGINGALFGFGNYAKTQILPNIAGGIKITKIHDIDPTIIGTRHKEGCDLSTDPRCLDEEIKVGFVAGYHHTHANLARQIIEAGAVAVVEKPVVTTFEQLEELLEVEKKFPGRLFSCYHMRYNPLFKQASEDLIIWKNDAVHMSAQVYEVPLPKFHWYRWPNSQSHVVSNGCHWLDLFLLMNDYSTPKRVDLRLINETESISLVELENGASLCLHLTHEGSPRIGVQDYVSLRANGRTVTVINGSEYRYEDEICLRRRQKINRMDAYKNMYKTISKSIGKGGKGDGYRILETTNKLVLELNEIYFNQLNERKQERLEQNKEEAE